MLNRFIYAYQIISALMFPIVTYLAVGLAAERKKMDRNRIHRGTPRPRR